MDNDNDIGHSSLITVCFDLEFCTKLHNNYTPLPLYKPYGNFIWGKIIKIYTSYQSVKIFCHCYRYNRKIPTPGIATTRYQLLTLCQVWKVYKLFCNTTYFQSPASGSKRSKIWKPVLIVIVLVKSFPVNECISIAMEYHLYFLSLQ